MADYTDDPVYLDSRREALFILCLWCTCMVWTIGYCYLSGYTEHPRVAGEVTSWLPDLSGFDHDPTELTTPFGLGIPGWVFWGIAVPWVGCVLISSWFCFGFMRDDDERVRAEDQSRKESAQ